MKILVLLIFTIFVGFIISFGSPAFAQPIPNSNPNDNKDPVTNQGRVNSINIGNQLPKSNLGVPLQTNLIGTILRNVLTIFFAVGGIGAVIYFVWGAVDWILSGGDKEKVSNARKKMTHAIVGLVLLALSFVIIQVVGEVVGFNPLLPIKIKSLGEQ